MSFVGFVLILIRGRAPDLNRRRGSVSRGVGMDGKCLSVWAISTDAARPVEDADRGIGMVLDLDRRPDKTPTQRGGLSWSLSRSKLTVLS
jgi:hypothetical protein